jgi:predicted nucleic acid-binding protein
MTTSDDLAWLDTNILVYATDNLSPFHASRLERRERGRKEERALGVTPQGRLEFYAVVIDSRRVSQSLDSADAIKEIRLCRLDPGVKKIFQTPAVVQRAVALREKYNISRQGVCDALIVATTLSNDGERIYTCDVNHFSRCEAVKVLHPAEKIL